MGDGTFTRDKLLWLDQVAEDARISAGAFRLAYVLASRFLSRETGVAYPSQETLAGILHLTDRHLLRLTNELVRGGYLTVQRGGRGRSNRYRIVADDRTNMSGQRDHDDSTRPDIFVPSKNYEGTFSSGMTGQICPPNPMNEPIGGSGAPDGAPARPAPDGAAGENFQAFADAYPKPVAPDLAALFDDIVSSGEATPEDIIEGARRAQSRGQYATAAGPWLRGRGWLKEREAKERSRSGHRRRQESAMEAAMRMIQEEHGG